MSNQSASAVFAAIPRLTVKGEALHLLAESAYGTDEVAVLRLAANVVDRELVTVGRDAYQLVQINTSTGVTSTNLDTASTADLVLPLTAHGLVSGAILRAENEYLQVKSVKDANTVVVSRGYAGSTVASHVDGTTIYKKGATGLTANKTYVPVGATLTPAAAGPEIAKGMTALGSLGWSFSYAANAVTGFRTANGSHDALSETLTGVNNVWGAAASWGGIEAAGVESGLAMRVPTAAEVALGSMQFRFPFDVTFYRVTVFTTASKASVSWDGAVTVTNNVASLDNAGAVDWATTDTVMVEAWGN